MGETILLLMGLFLIAVTAYAQITGVLPAGRAGYSPTSRAENPFAFYFFSAVGLLIGLLLAGTGAGIVPQVYFVCLLELFTEGTTTCPLW